MRCGVDDAARDETPPLLPGGRALSRLGRRLLITFVCNFVCTWDAC